MTETVAQPYERLKPPSPDAALEQARSLALASSVQMANAEFAEHRAAKGKGDYTDEQKTRQWLGFITNLQEGNHDVTLVQDKKLMIALSTTSNQLRAVAENQDLGEGFKNIALNRLIAKKGAEVTVELADRRVITIPMSVLQEAHMITHKDAHLAALQGNKQAVTEAYLNSATGAKTGSKVEDLTPDAIKEVAGDTHNIRAESMGKYMDHMIAQATSEGTIPADLQRRIDQLKELQDKMKTQVIATADDVSDMLEIMTSREFTGIEIDELNNQINETRQTLNGIQQQMVDLSPSSETWKQLNKEKMRLHYQLKDLTIQKGLRQRSTTETSRSAIGDFFERAQNGEYSQDVMNKINGALESGKFDDLMSTALEQMKTAGKSPEEIEAAKQRMDELREKGMKIAGGAMLILLMLILQSATSGAKR
jgi:hypothetical protein